VLCYDNVIREWSCVGAESTDGMELTGACVCV